MTNKDEKISPISKLALIVERRISKFGHLDTETQEKSILKKWTIFIIIACISPVIFMFIYSFFLPSDREVFSKEEFAGVVSKKFRDQKNHNLRTVLIKQTGKDIYVLILAWDTLFYKKTHINDSVLKIKNFDSIITIRKDTSFISKIQCRPE